MSAPCTTGRTVGFANPISPVSRLLQELPPESQVMLRKLASVLAMPVDAPALHTVLTIAEHVVVTYGKTLVTPSMEFQQIVRMLGMLKNESCRNTQLCSVIADDPLRRRLLKNASWALLLEMSSVSIPENLVVATGVELAYCLATSKSFPNGYPSASQFFLENR